ncbi:hypothetical protein P7F88_11765 [Vibrio hannami]|uniref:hypothetical protein n=1 Tax=Vibrio hannami TaxID=2717094 RepID=UPI00240F753D|nr:hypothetical protein [Vibrio hannami]MDG3086738.1 hypothetical protein [Vibrio hannami]
MHPTAVRFARNITSASRRRCSTAAAPVAKQNTPANSLVKRVAMQKRPDENVTKAA